MEAFLWTLVGVFIVYLSYLAGRIVGRRKARRGK